MPKSKKVSVTNLSPSAPSLRPSPTWIAYQKKSFAGYLAHASSLLGGTNEEKESVLEDMLKQWLGSNLELSEVKAAYAQMMQSAAKGLVPNVKIYVKKKLEKMIKGSRGMDRFDINVLSMQDFLENDPEAQFMADHWDLAERLVTSEGWARTEEITSILENLFENGVEDDDDEPVDINKNKNPADVKINVGPSGDTRKVAPPYPTPAVRTDPKPAVTVNSDPRKAAASVRSKPKSAEALGAPPAPVRILTIEPLDIEPLDIVPIDTDPMDRSGISSTTARLTGRPVPKINNDKPKTGFTAMQQTFHELAAKSRQPCPARPHELVNLVKMTGYTYDDLGALYAKAKGPEHYELKKGLFRKIYQAVKNLDQGMEPEMDKKRISLCLDWAENHYKKKAKAAAAAGE